MLFAWPAVQAAPYYTVQDLGTLGGTTATAYGINAAGVAVGVSSNSFGVRSAFSNFGMGMLQLPSSGAESTAAGINNDGTIAGTVYGARGAQATLWQNGAAISIGGGDSYAMAINDAGQVTGSVNGRAFLYTNGTVTSLGTLSGGSWSAGYAVNNNGQVAGYAMRSNGTFQAFVWSQAIGMSAIAGLGGMNSYAMAINDAGQVAGSAQVRSGYMHAYETIHGQPRDLGTLGGGASYGYGINAAGDVVGYSWTLSNTAMHAFLFEDGVMRDLNDLIATQDWILTEAYAINASGQIVGTGTRNGIQHAFLLNPVVPQAQSLTSDATSDVPEPSTLSLLLIPLALLGWNSRRRWTWDAGARVLPRVD